MASEIIDIRRFAACEFLPLLQAETEFWSTKLRWDYSSSVEMITHSLEERRLSGYALVQEGRIGGYSFFFYEGEKGLIGNLFVQPHDAALPQALLLVDHVIETLLATPGIRRVETQLPHFTLEELDPGFRPHCFKGYHRLFMVSSLKNRPPRRGGSRGAGEAHLFKDFLIEPWERRHDRQAAQLLYRTYRHHVDAAINDQYSSEAGAGRLVESIVHHRGCGESLPRASLVALHRPTQKLAGILALTAVRAATAHIPQIAVSGEFQGTGLGTAMMDTAFEELARRGLEEVSLTVTETNDGAVRLYERLGFETLRRFGAFVWNR